MSKGKGKEKVKTTSQSLADSYAIMCKDGIRFRGEGEDENNFMHMLRQSLHTRSGEKPRILMSLIIETNSLISYLTHRVNVLDGLIRSMVCNSKISSSARTNFVVELQSAQGPLVVTVGSKLVARYRHFLRLFQSSLAMLMRYRAPTPSKTYELPISKPKVYNQKIMSFVYKMDLYDPIDGGSLVGNLFMSEVSEDGGNTTSTQSLMVKLFSLYAKQNNYSKEVGEGNDKRRTFDAGNDDRFASVFDGDFKSISNESQARKEEKLKVLRKQLRHAKKRRDQYAQKTIGDKIEKAENIPPPSVRDFQFFMISALISNNRQKDKSGKYIDVPDEYTYDKDRKDEVMKYLDAFSDKFKKALTKASKEAKSGNLKQKDIDGIANFGLDKVDDAKLRKYFSNRNKFYADSLRVENAKGYLMTQTAKEEKKRKKKRRK